MAKAGLAQDNGLPLETRVSRLLAGRTLVMIGMMGAGKSSIGRRLANRLGMAFVDADSRDRAGRERFDSAIRGNLLLALYFVATTYCSFRCDRIRAPRSPTVRNDRCPVMR